MFIVEYLVKVEIMNGCDFNGNLDMLINIDGLFFMSVKDNIFLVRL